MDFICPKHRDTVLSIPTGAIRYWQQWMQHGREHQSIFDFGQAHSFFALRNSKLAT